jgi:hypothetical protein
LQRQVIAVTALGALITAVMPRAAVRRNIFAVAGLGALAAWVMVRTWDCIMWMRFWSGAVRVWRATRSASCPRSRSSRWAPPRSALRCGDARRCARDRPPAPVR